MLRRDLLHEQNDASMSDNHFYDGSFDVTFFDRDTQNIPRKLQSLGLSGVSGNFACQIHTTCFYDILDNISQK